MERPRILIGVAAAVVMIVAAAVIAEAVRSVSSADQPGAAGQGPDEKVHAGGKPGVTAGLSSSPTPRAETSAGRSRLLRPDVMSLRAEDLRMVRRDGRRVLRFAALLANRGPGPMVLRPLARRHCAPEERHARQLLYVDRNGDGVYQHRRDTRVRSRSAGCMLDHPTHDHWHFDAMAAYRLVDPASRRGVAGRAKVSFCLRDNRVIPGTQPRQRREFFGECDRHRVQGISPGWVDVYDNQTPGQSLRLPARLPDGLYCLVTRADPRNQLVETNEQNNARALPVRIRGMSVSIPRTGRCRSVVR